MQPEGSKGSLRQKENSRPSSISRLVSASCFLILLLGVFFQVFACLAVFTRCRHFEFHSLGFWLFFLSHLCLLHVEESAKMSLGSRSRTHQGVISTE